MSGKNKRVKNEEIKKKEKQFLIYIISFIILLIALIVIVMFIENENIRALALGIYFFVYSVIGIVLKMPIFNRQYMYGSHGFDNSFGLRQYFGFAIMLLFGVMLILASFVS